MIYNTAKFQNRLNAFEMSFMQDNLCLHSVVSQTCIFATLKTAYFAYLAMYKLEKTNQH